MIMCHSLMIYSTYVYILISFIYMFIVFNAFQFPQLQFPHVKRSFSQEKGQFMLTCIGDEVIREKLITIVNYFK